jgi:hypothetical protein
MQNVQEVEEYKKSFVGEENIRYSLVRVGVKYGVYIFDRDAKTFYHKQFFQDEKQANGVYENLLEKVAGAKEEVLVNA